MTLRARLLAYLGEHPDSTCDDIAEALGVDRRHMSTVLSVGVSWGGLTSQRSRHRGPSLYRIATTLTDRLAARLGVEADDDAVDEEVAYLIAYHDAREVPRAGHPDPLAPKGKE